MTSSLDFVIINQNGKSTKFLFTLNNYTDADVASVKEWGCKYLIFGKEVGEKGTPHLQGYVCFENPRTLSSLKKLSGTAHWEASLGTPKQASEYCEKDGDVFEKGVRPLSQVQKGDGEKERWRTALLCVQEKRWDDMDPRLLCNNLKNIQYAANTLALSKKRKAVTMDEPPVCIWIWGPTGTGKSHMADTDFPDPLKYRKDVNTRNWDNYAEEDCIYFEDVDKDFACFGGDLKKVCR